MKKIIFVISVIILSACKSSEIGSIVGGSIGGVVGGNLGSEVSNKLGRVVGTGVGIYLGSEFGSKMFSKINEDSQRKLNDTTQDVLETGVDGDVGRWNNPSDNSYGEFKVEETKYIHELDTTCRFFTQTINHRGKKEVVKGKACRKPNGSWEVKS